MTICLCASIKFKNEIEKVSAVLKNLGIDHRLPSMELPKELETADMVPALVKEHLEKINLSEAILVVNPTGYFGNSVKIEIGYAKGLGKKIYFLKKTNEPELDCIADGFVGLNDLSKLKNG